MAKTTCPCCGAQLNILPADQVTSYQTPGLMGRLFARKGSQTYQHAVDMALTQTSSQTEEPARPAVPATGGKRKVTTWRPRDIGSDVIAPAFWSIVGGAMLGLTSVPFAITWRWPAWIPFSIWLGSTTVGFFASSWRILIDLSLIAHEDDLEIAPPPPPAPPPMPIKTSRTIRTEVVDRDGQRSQFAELPDTVAMHKFARLVTMVQPSKKEPEGFTEATAKLANLDVDAGKLDGDPAEWGFRQIREVFLARGWGNWKNPKHHNLGFILTVAGRALLRQIAESTPPPQEDSYAE